MSDVKLKINGEKDFTTNHPLITFGRTVDNSVSFDDTNVSRYHARIEQRDNGYWLVDQQSSNGTSVNGQPVEDEILLKDGDVILFGGTSEVVFNPDQEGNGGDLELSGANETAPAPKETEEEKSGKGSPLMIVAGVVVGLAILAVVVAGFVIWGGGTKCEASASISGLESGDVVSESKEVVADVRQKSPCVGEVVFLLDGKEFGRAKSEPYKVPLEAQMFADLSDGRDHQVKIVLLDAKGEVIPEIGDEIAVVFETLATPTPTPEVTTTVTVPTAEKNTPKSKIGEIEIQQMVRDLLRKDFPNAPGYKLDQEFLIEVNKKTGEYASDGYFERARQFKDVINVAYVRERNLDAPIGYILAMSRTKFTVMKQGGEEGLWRISPQILAANGVDLNALCGTETLSDPSQKCSAKVSAEYLKTIVLNIFEGDIIYSIAAVGLTPQEAAIFNSKLNNRVDFWSAIRNSPKQRDEVVRFFAAGIVTEYPEKFGLTDRRLSEHYPK